MIYYHELLDEFRDDANFTTLIGPEELLAESVIFGGDGGIPGGANVHPRLYVSIYDAAKKGDLAKIAELQRELFLLRRIYQCGAYSSSLIKGVKCALKCLGVCGDFMAEPFHCFGEEQELKIKAVLAKLELL
jgi:4-hydroxy-tetrahydrodipicolinate synthase